MPIDGDPGRHRGDGQISSESTTSPSVKRMLVDTSGHRPMDQRRKSAGRHGLQPQSARWCRHPRDRQQRIPVRGRLLDEVAGDAEAVAERRDEIIAAMAKTAKFYFGDVADLPAVGCGATGRTGHRGRQLAADTARWQPVAGRTPGGTASSRCCSVPGSPPTGFRARSRRYSPMLACWTIRSRRSPPLLARYPTPRPVQLHPACALFVTLCKTLGKPVNFCAGDRPGRGAGGAATRCGVHDSLRRRCGVIIPGTASVAGITRMG